MRGFRRGNRGLLAGGGLLVVNSAYLAASGEPHLVYFGNLLLHLLLGVGLLFPFTVWWWRRRRQPTILAGGLLLLASAGCGIALAVVGNLTPMRPLLLAHIGLAAMGLATLLLAFWSRRRERRWRWAAALLVVALAAPPLALWWQATHPDPKHVFDNPPAPLAMEREAMGGADGPFFPSSVHTANGEVVPSSVYLKPESCARSGCHPDVYAQWEESAHRFSSFNNQWYRKSIEYMQEVAGVEASKWCGGCHDPAVLQSGLMDTPIKEIVHTPEAQAGLTCTACHMISKVRSSMGQGDYEITIPPLHDLATSDNRVLNAAHDFLVRLDPEPHRRTFIKPFFRGPDSSEYCSTCHKVHLDVPVNSYRWTRGFNEYDNWQASGVSGYGARSFYYPPAPMNCVDCHMPRVPSDDAGSDDGMIRSHRFPGANTALPIANRDAEQLRVVTEFLQARQVTVDIFAMTASRPTAKAEDAAPLREGPELATTFAVGEEQGMAVGAGAIASGPAEPIYAPLDRLPATVRRGESTRIDVVVRTRGVGHFFPGGTVDAYDCWLELKGVDDRGRTIYWSGMADLESPVEPGAHFYRSLLIDAHGHPINKRNAFAARAVVYVRLIPPGAADTVHFRLDVPPGAGDTITLTARLNYRKFSWYNTHFSFAGVPVPGSPGSPDEPRREGPSFSPHYDDREFVFTGDTADVSGEIKTIPNLPLIVMAEDTATIKVVDAGSPLPDMSSPRLDPKVDRERFNDYGIGLFLQGDLRGARNAFEEVTAIEPGYVDGWVNLARVALAEGDLEAADEALAEALEIDPALPRTHFFLGLLEKERGQYDRALEHFRVAADRYPEDRVVRNQIGRVLFLERDHAAAVAELQQVLEIDPEDLMAHYTLMLAHRGMGQVEESRRHQRLYERFKADEASQILTGDYREAHPHDNNERQSIHEHTSVPAAEIQAFESATVAPHLEAKRGGP